MYTVVYCLFSNIVQAPNWFGSPLCILDSIRNFLEEVLPASSSTVEDGTSHTIHANFTVSMRLKFSAKTMSLGVPDEGGYQPLARIHVLVGCKRSAETDQHANKATC